MDAGNLIDIAVLDPLIIAAGYYSFADIGRNVTSRGKNEQ
jgi:DNA repair protein RadC